MTDEGLVIVSDTVGYEDLFAKGGGDRPGAVELTSIFTLEDDNLVMTTRSSGYNVDPKTLERSSADELPLSTYRE